MKELTCIVCLIGCHLSVDNDLNVTGKRRQRFKKYGFLEMTNPTRLLTTTVKTVFNELPRLSVKSSSPIPKALIFEAKTLLYGIIIKNHVKIVDVLLPNILGIDIDFVSTKSI